MFGYLARHYKAYNNPRNTLHGTKYSALLYHEHVFFAQNLRTFNSRGKQIINSPLNNFFDPGHYTQKPILRFLIW